MNARARASINADWEEYIAHSQQKFACFILFTTHFGLGDEKSYGCEYEFFELIYVAVFDTSQHTDFVVSHSTLYFSFSFSLSFVRARSCSRSILFLFLLCTTNIVDSFLFVAFWMRALNKLTRLKICYTHKTFTTRVFSCSLVSGYFFVVSICCLVIETFCWFFFSVGHTTEYQKYFVMNLLFTFQWHEQGENSLNKSHCD